MTWPQGLNIRNTEGFTTDGTDEDWWGANTYADYPLTSAQGNSFGKENTSGGWMGASNRSSGNDRRIAGSGDSDSGVAGDYLRVDLDAAGQRDVRGAFGDSYYYARNVAWELRDTSTKLVDLSTGATSAPSGAPPAGKFNDATDTEYTHTTWPGSNSAVTVTFATTIARFYCPTGRQYINHVWIGAVSAAAASRLPARSQARRIAPLLSF